MYNHFPFDPLGKNDSCGGAIACREDLAPSKAERYPFGGIDGKVSSGTLAMKQNSPLILAKLGPTDETLPVFCWSSFEKSSGSRNDRAYSHEGQPDCFKFPWQEFPPDSPLR